MAIREYLLSRRVHFEHLMHQPAASASRRAQCLHVPGRIVAKTVLVRTAEGFRLAVLPSTHRIDLERLERLLEEPQLRLASEDEIAAVFGDCERGAVPAFGHLYGVPTIVDTILAGDSEIIVEGNSRHESLRLRYRDFAQLEGPRRGRFAVLTTPPPRPAPRCRKAG
jgi:Ala-tRNA(Pro) deacylase